MSKILFILESPGKVRSVQAYLGDEYLVESSVGHIRTLGTDKDIGIDINANFAPYFCVDDKKRDVVAKLKKCNQNCRTVYLASDWDREGEGIAWHIKDTLGLSDTGYKRIVFKEITKPAILEGIRNAGVINMNMVYSQQARQILDKLIGYKVSPCLWKEYANYKLSAGRVQSVAVRLILEREREIDSFKSAGFYRPQTGFVFTAPSGNVGIIPTLKGESDVDIKNVNEVSNIINNTDSGLATYWIEDLKKTQTKRKPTAPFITSSLQQEASNKLGMSPDMCMSAAQKLYEAGLITYMRTDSYIIGEDALGKIGGYVKQEYGDRYYSLTKYTKKAKGAQEAHEAIRPTKIDITDALGDKIGPREKKLYQMIWRRTVASQMTPADVEIKTIKIRLDHTKCKPPVNPTSEGVKQYTFSTKFEKILFDGFLKVYSYGDDGEVTDDNPPEVDNANTPADTSVGTDTATSKRKKKPGVNIVAMEKIFDSLKQGQQVWCVSFTAQERETTPPNARYTEASLVKKLEELKIGRPSTYASIITRIKEREYVEKKTIAAKSRDITYLAFEYPRLLTVEKKSIKTGGENNKLFITGLGVMVTDFLTKNFDKLMDYGFTAAVEEKLDNIANGTVVWNLVIGEVWNYLHPVIEKVGAKLLVGGGGGTNSKIALGINPTSGKAIEVIKTRNGWAICEIDPSDKKKCRWAAIGLLTPQSITLPQALGMLVYPKQLGVYNGHPIEVYRAKSIYIKYNTKNYSIDIYKEQNPADSQLDPETLTLDNAIKIIDFTTTQKSAFTKLAAEEHRFDGIEDFYIKNGPYGYYVRYLDQFNIPLSAKYKKDISSVTQTDVESIISKWLGKNSGAVAAKTTVTTSANNKPSSTTPTTTKANTTVIAKKSGSGRGRATGRGRGRGK